MKYLSRSFIVILVLSLILCMTACQKPIEEKYIPESAVALWNKIDETMTAAQSMEMRSTVLAVFYSGGYEFKLHGSAYIFASKETHFTDSEMTLSCEATSFEQKTYLMEAYYEGKMYHMGNDGTYDQKLCSAMTHDEYDQIQSGTLTEDVDLADCTSARYTQNEDGTWILEFSGYTKKTIDSMIDSLSMTQDMLAVPIADVKVTICANADFLVNKMEFSFVFAADDEGLAPTFLMTAEYAGYNSAVFDAGKLNTEEFTEVDDVRILESMQSALTERQNAASGKFNLDLKSIHKLQNQTTTFEEKDVVTYGRKNGAYYYTIMSEMEGQTFEIRYQNGEQNVTMDGQTTTGSQSEAEAKYFVDALINSAYYTSAAITDIQKLEDGVYLLIGEPKNMEQAMGLTDVDVASVIQECKVTFENNKLMKIENKLVIEGKYSADSITITVESLVEFDDTTATV